MSGPNLDTFELQSRLGGGNFSEVFHATNSNGHPFALKILEETNFEFCVGDVFHEKDLMEKCRSNNNIVSAYTILKVDLEDDKFPVGGRIQDPDNVWAKPPETVVEGELKWKSSGFRLVIVMEFCPGARNLTSYIKGLYCFPLFSQESKVEFCRKRTKE